MDDNTPKNTEALEAKYKDVISQYKELEEVKKAIVARIKAAKDIYTSTIKEIKGKVDSDEKEKLNDKIALEKQKRDGILNLEKHYIKLNAMEMCHIHIEKIKVETRLIFNFIAAHYGFIGAYLYVIGSAWGFSFLYAKLNSYHINALNYTSTPDFILSAIQQPLLLILLFIIFAILVATYFMALGLERHVKTEKMATAFEFFLSICSRVIGRRCMANLLVIFFIVPFLLLGVTLLPGLSGAYRSHTGQELLTKIDWMLGNRPASESVLVMTQTPEAIIIGSKIVKRLNNFMIVKPYDESGYPVALKTENISSVLPIQKSQAIEFLRANSDATRSNPKGSAYRNLLTQFMVLPANDGAVNIPAPSPKQIEVALTPPIVVPPQPVIINAANPFHAKPWQIETLQNYLEKTNHIGNLEIIDELVSVYFAHGKHELTADMKAEIAKQLERFRYSQDLQLLALGYANSHGEEITNTDLSKMRADNTVAFIQERFPYFGEDKLFSTAMGEKISAISEPQESGLNRRVQLFLCKSGEGSIKK